MFAERMVAVYRDISSRIHLWGTFHGNIYEIAQPSAPAARPKRFHLARDDAILHLEHHPFGPSHPHLSYCYRLGGGKLEEEFDKVCIFIVDFFFQVVTFDMLLKDEKILPLRESSY